MKEYCFGIDIGGTTVKCGLFDAEGERSGEMGDPDTNGRITA